MTTTLERTGEVVVGDKVATESVVESKRLGLLGGLFGSAENAPTNIAGIILLLFTVAGIVLLFMPKDIPSMETVEFLKLVLPVITLVLGYLFGKK